MKPTVAMPYTWEKYNMRNTKRKEKSTNGKPNHGIYQDKIDWLLAIDAA